MKNLVVLVCVLCTVAAIPVPNPNNPSIDMLRIPLNGDKVRYYSIKYYEVMQNESRDDIILLSLGTFFAVFSDFFFLYKIFLCMHSCGFKTL